MQPLRTLSWFGICLMAVFSLMTFWPDDADARRFGGGGSFGSRGSKSFSTPQKAPQQRTPTQAQRAGQQPQKSGWKSALMGGLGGLLIGGLLGSLLFGEFGGVGLMDFVILAAIAFFAWKFFKSRRGASQPGMARTAGGPYGHQAPMDGHDPDHQGMPMGGGGGAFSTPDADEVTQGLEHIMAMDPGFDEAQFLQGAQGAFEAIQRAWADWNVERLRPLVTDRMWGMVQQQAQELQAAGERNILEKLQFQRVEISEAWQESGSDYLTVRFMVSMLDYTLNAQGQVIDGSPDNLVEVEEYWTFTRETGGTGGPHWFLTAVQQPGEVARGAL